MRLCENYEESTSLVLCFLFLSGSGWTLASLGLGSRRICFQVLTLVSCSSISALSCVDWIKTLGFCDFVA